jgi:tetratricopeptide (TPR) repeat protein
MKSILGIAALVVSCSLGGILLFNACAGQQDQLSNQDGVCRCPETPIVDPALMAFLSRARALHIEADVKMDQQKPEDAIASLRKITSTALPPGGPSPEAQEVLADAHARIAEILIPLAKFDEARQELTKGLGHATEPTYFRGHLFELQGHLEAKRAEQLTKDGKTEEANKARTEAIKASEEAIKIQELVIKKALEPGKQ